MKDLTKGSIIKSILWFSIPVLLGNLFNLAYNLADTRIIGQLLGTEALAAVGSVSTLSDVLVGFIVGLSNGFAVYTARLFGMGDRSKVRKSFASSLLLGVGVAIIISCLAFLFLPLLLTGLHVLPEHRGASTAYIQVIILGLCFSVIYNVLAASLRAIGDAFTPLIFLVVSACLNVGLDILFVGPLALGVRGAAIATVTSQILAAAMCMAYTWKKYPFLHFEKSDFRLSREYAHPLMSGGMSMGMMSCLVAFGTLALQSAINALGSNIIVAHTGTRKLTGMYMLPFQVLGTTMATFSGQNFGARKIDRIRKGLWSTLGISWCWVVVVQIMSYTISPYLISSIIATKAPEILEPAVLYQKFDTLFYVLVPTISILRNSLQGMGDHVTPVISSSFELIGKVAIAFVLVKALGYWGVILAEPIVWSIMVIPLIISTVKLLSRKNDVNE